MPDIDIAAGDSPTLEIATGEPPAIDITAPTVPPLNIEAVTVSVPGPQGGSGADGKSAYQIAIDNGFAGTEQEWLESLRGLDGADGRDGRDGVSDYNQLSNLPNLSAYARTTDLPDMSDYPTKSEVVDQINSAAPVWKIIYSNDDVNRQKYLTAGYYSVRSYAESRTIANLPTQEGTSNKVVGWLEVRNLTPGQIPGVHAWAYAMQEMTGIDGKLYRRMIRSEGNPKQVIYGAWARG